MPTYTSEKPSYVAPVVILGLGIAIGMFVAVLLTSADPLSRDVRTALATQPPDRGMFNLISECVWGRPLTGAARGLQIGLLGFFLAGIPLGLMGLVLAVQTRRLRWLWPGSFSRLFYAAEIVQLASLSLAALLVLLFVVTMSSHSSLILGTDDAIVLGVQVGMIVCCVVGFRAWRYLEQIAARS